MDVPELQGGVRARETHVHDETLHNAEAQVVASLLVCGPAQSVLTRAILLADGREWNDRLLPGEETGSRRNLVVMDTGRAPS